MSRPVPDRRATALTRATPALTPADRRHVTARATGRRTIARATGRRATARATLRRAMASATRDRATTSTLPTAPA